MNSFYEVNVERVDGWGILSCLILILGNIFVNFLCGLQMLYDCSVSISSRLSILVICVLQMRSMKYAAVVC